MNQSIKATWSEQSRINDVEPVRRSNNDDLAASFHPIHFVEQLA